jgi:MFS family permease
MEHESFRRLLYSASAVVFGVMGQAVARGWLARDLTGSNAGLGGVMLAFGAAMLVATPWSGVAADRFAKRTVLLVAVAMLMVSSLAIGLAVVTGIMHYWMLLAASMVQAVAFALFLPARIAAITDLVEPNQIRPAVVLSQTSVEAMRVIAPALAGVLIGVSWFGVGGVFLLAAGTSTLAAIVLIGLPRLRPAPRPARTPVAEMVDAYHYVRSRRALGLIALTTVGVVVVGFPYLTFLPTLADERYHIGPGGYGLMAGTAGLGAVTAGVVVPRRGWTTRHPWRMIAGSAATLGCSLIALAAAAWLWGALVALFAVGASGLVFQTTSQSQMLALSDTEYHGRMQSMVILGFSGFGLAALPLGMLADAITLEATLAAMGATVLVVAAAFTFKRTQHRRQLVDIELA